MDEAFFFYFWYIASLIMFLLGTFLGFSAPRSMSPLVAVAICTLTELSRCSSVEQVPSAKCHRYTLPETNIAHENPHVPGKYHQDGGFAMAMYGYVSLQGCNFHQRTSTNDNK